MLRQICISLLSIVPQFQVEHVIDKDGIHFLIVAVENIAKGAEVTIPFDYSYKD